MACDSVNKVFHEGLGSAKSDIEPVAGIRRVTLAAFCRTNRANIYTHPERLQGL